MAYLRHAAIQKANERQPYKAERPSLKISEYFATNAFTLDKMEELLSTEDYKNVVRSIKTGEPIDAETANAVAVTVKGWAMSKGVTHYAHWFLPLTNQTASKQDSFFDKYHSNGIERFKGSTLIQQEPDGSSFPNGGIRATHSARGYTVWDPASPMFIYENSLFIPSVFISYTGDTLDYKAPLLKAQRAIDKASVDVCKYFDANITQVNSSLGCEQEYFLVDKAIWAARPDLVMGGRTVFGGSSPRGQQLEDHYFATIPDRVLAYMEDFETQAYLVGIPVTTKHNEVAPGQFEVAPVYEDINLAADHNMLLMEIMDKVADKHNLKVLLHEKPFAGINGSGKHNNWSLITNTGRNLLAPSYLNYKDGLFFLTFFVNTIKAIEEYGDIVRASIASAGNDHRLGANEAPPAIISCYLGEYLDSMLNDFETTGSFKTGKDIKPEFDLGIRRLPKMAIDNTDRNRTSPFAFTGNKFELRAVGSTANCGLPMTVLNSIVAAQLISFKNEVDGMIKAGKKKDDAIAEVLRRYISESKKIRFEGDGYSEEWVQEALKRGLSNVKDTPRALDFLTTDKAKKVFLDTEVFTESEIAARHEIFLENYIKKIDIESNVMEELFLNQILPVAIDFQNKLIANVKGLKELGVEASAGEATLKEVSALLSKAKQFVTDMATERANIDHHNTHKAAVAYCDNIKGKYFDEIRKAVDSLELIVDDAAWPLPKYREMLFIK